MPNIKHGSLAAPTGITLTGCLLHELRTRIEDFSVEVMDAVGAFSAGKSLRKKVTQSMSGEGLSTMSLPTVGSGAATAASPHIDSSEDTEKNEGADAFSVEAHYFTAGEGNYSA